MNGVDIKEENEEGDVEDASKVIAQLLRALAKMEASKVAKETTKIAISLPQKGLPNFDHQKYAFQSDLQYGSYNGVIHG